MDSCVSCSAFQQCEAAKVELTYAIDVIGEWRLCVFYGLHSLLVVILS